MELSLNIIYNENEKWAGFIEDWKRQLEYSPGPSSDQQTNKLNEKSEPSINQGSSSL